MNQIGRGNIMAISGGRVERRGNEMILPSTKDQQVVIGYNSVPDLYYVRAEQKINTGKDKGTNRILAQWDEVYADEIGELAYQASLKPANLNSENKEYWKLGKGNQFADRLVDRRSGKLVSRDSRNLPSKPATEESPSLSSGSRGRDYYNYDITTTDEGNGLLDQVHDYLEENPLIKDDITTDIADMLGGDGIVEANGFDTKKAFDLVTGGDDEFQDYMDIVDDAMDALNNGSLAKHKATVRDTNVRLESAKPGSNEAGKLEAIRDRSYEWIGDINKYSRVSTIKDKKNIEASDVATRMISKEQDSLWNARSAITEKYIEDIASAGKESKRRVPIEKMESDTNKVPEYNLALSSGSVFGDKPASKTLADKADGLSLSSGENKKIYDEIGKSILEALIEMEKNPTATYWDVPWRTPTLYAKNPTRSRLYQGMNSLLLANSHRQNKYRGNFWAGKTQWAKFGGKVKDGKDGVNILVPREGSTGKYFIVQTVYNLDDIEGLPDAYVKKLLDVGKERLDPALKIKDAEAVIEEIKPVIKFGGDGAFFSPSEDLIQMPLYEMFKSPEQYYGTLFHELTHWTGGAARMDRQTVRDYGKNKKIRASEELIAEMGSSFLLAAVGITPEVRKDHVVYIKSWISNLKEDPGAFIKAMEKAQQAADYIMDRSPTMRRLAGVPDTERKGKPDVAEKATEAVAAATDEAKDSVVALSSGTQVGVRKVKELRYFGDEKEYGSGVTQRDSSGRILDESGALSLSSGAKPIVSLDGKTTIPRLDDSVSYREKYKFLPDEFEPTEQQKASIDTLVHMLESETSGIVAIGAGAGSGKTTNLKQNARAVAALYPGKQIYYTVFNRGNAKDGNRVMPRNTGVATGNQIAYWSLVLGTGDAFYGAGTTRKIQLGVGPRDSKKLRGAKRNTVNVATTFEGETKEFTGEIPGYRELGYTSYDSAPNIAERLAKDGIVDEETDDGFTISQNLKKALGRFAESSDEKLSKQHFLLRDIEKIQALQKGEPVPTEDSIDEKMVQYAQMLWDETVDPKSNVLIPQDYQIKMWALTNPDLRYDKGLIGHRPNETVFDKVFLGTVEEMNSGKIKVGDLVEFKIPETGEKVAAVIRKLNPPSKKETKKGELSGNRQVTGTVSIVSVTSDKPLDVFMFDEAQDVNPVLAKVLADNAKNMPIIMVGDSRQAIYGFRGAMDALEKANATFRLPLTRSFRYGAMPAYLANVVLMQGNIDDFNFYQNMGTPEKNIWHHVVGEAQNVVINALNINGPDGKILPKKELEKKLKFIEVKYKLGGRAVDFKGKNEKEVKDIISKLYDEHVPRAEGQIVEDMTGADAVLTSTNSGVMVEALKVIQDGINAHQIAYLDLDGIEDIKNPQELAGRLRTISEKYTLDGVAVDLIEILEKDGRDSMLNAVNELREEYAPGGADGKIPAIGIPADTHEKFLDFFTQLDWIIGDLDKKFGIEGRPKPSKLLKDVWRFDKKKGRYPSKDEMLAKIDKMIKGGESELRTLYNLAYPKSKDGGVRGDAKGARFFKDLLRPQGQKYTDINGTEVKYQGLRPMREGINLPNMESGRDHITTEEMDRVGKLKPGTKSGSSQKISWIIPKKEESVSDGEVFVKLHIGENGKPSGALIIAGDGAHGGKYKVRRWNKAKKTWSPIEEGKPGKIDYHGDISKVIKKMKAEYPDAVIEFRQGLIQQVGTAQTFPSDISDDFVPPMKGDLPDSSVPRASLPGFFIQGKDSEETARLANELGNRVRQLATEGNTDTDIMTVHVSKGREWKRVRLADDFKNPEDMVPVIPEEELAKLSPKDRLAVERQLQLMRREEHNKVYIAITRAQEQIDIGAVLAKLYFDDSQNASIKSAKDKIAENPDGIYDELQAPAGFYVPYSGDTEARDAARKERRKRLDESFDRYVKSQGKTKDVAPEEDDEPEVEDESGGFDSGDPDFVDVAGPDDDGAEEFDEEDGDVQSLSLSSGAKKKTNRANRRLPFNEQDRQSVADRNILRSKKVPKKRKPAPSAEEFDDLALASGANTPEGRYARRLRAISLSSGSDDIGAGAKTQRVSGKKFAANIAGPRDLAAIRIDGDPRRNDKAKRKLEYAMKFWRGVRERGIALDPEDTTAERKNIEIKNAINSVSKGMAARPKVKIGKVSSNQIKDEVNPDEWFVPVSKLRDAVRIPTEFSSYPSDPDNPNSRMIARWTQTRPLNNDELGKMLALGKSDIAKLSDDDAGVTHDAVRFLLSEIGKQDGFDAWKLFAPTSEKEEGVSEMTPSEKFVENLGRANMRDRFIIETFGKDAFPYWIDKEENGVISQKEYASLGEVSETGKFRSTGIFSKKRGESEFGSMAEEMLLEEAVFGGDDTPSDLVKQSVVEAASAPSDKTSREQFDVDQLLESLGIDKSDKWHEELKRRMVESFGVDDVGLNTREIARNWEAGGVPTTYINEMIRTGMIPDAKSVWKKDESGKKLDQELAASKHSVYEALYEFTQSKHAADKAKNTRRNRDYILNSSDFTVSHKGVAARKGATFSKKTGDERRFSQGELQNVVNRFNEIFGTNYKIDDIFSAEQLRNATKRLREEGRTLYGDDASELGKRVILKKDKDKK
jgi:antirestriction protein ArdC